MSTEALSIAPAPGQDVADVAEHVAAVVDFQSAPASDPDHIGTCPKQPPTTFLHSPPDSNNTVKSDASDSELSDIDDASVLADANKPQDQPDPSEKPADAEAPPPQEPEEDIGEVLPDDWSGKVPIFRPTMHQFKDFTRFMKKVDSYGMKSGIIKIIPPKEWVDKLPLLHEMVKHVRVREPIKQDIMGSNGTYRQVNILHGRSYNVPQWRQMCEQSEHQPPAKRGERRANADKPKPPRRPAPAKPPADSTPSKKRGKGRATRGRGRPSKAETLDRPMTPVSPMPEVSEAQEGDVPMISIEEDGDVHDEPDEPRAPGRMGGSRQPKATKTQSTSARRKYSRREGSAMIDEAAFKDFDYRMDISEYTPERCEELERAYWKTLTYAAPLYGADMMGTLFDPDTETWNLNKLPNILDVLGSKIPGVNTAYLYFGMWKATFAWHLEDVDLYSINYLHFGAPKQWYSISQADARRFEAAMKNIWPADAKACDQFLRHKAFLISPQHLLQHYGIKVNKVVSYPGEFVVTYPYGYHSGYNLGYNCAEAVNFALDSWLEMGKIAKKCECAQAQDSVWINVNQVERKLRGEETEYEETDEEDDEDDDDDDDEPSGLPTPPASHGVKFKVVNRKRKRDASGKGAKVKVKKIRLRLKTKAEPPCCLCPNDIAAMELLPTDDGQKAHRICALYLPETYIDMVDGHEVVSNLSGIHKDRTGLKCLFCRSKRGACFQCSETKCTRAYHATCGLAAGVFIEEEEVPIFGEDQTEYKEQAFEFSCRFHRAKRDRKLDGVALENDDRIREAARSLKPGETCQLQYFRGDIFAGVVIENRETEEMLLVDILPDGDRLEIEWKWLRLPDPSDYHLPKASVNAIPMPASRKAKDQLNTKPREDDSRPRKDGPFIEGYVWAEFVLHNLEHNPHQVKVDLTKEDQVWHYLPQKSTDTKPQFTENLDNPRHNLKGDFLDTVPKFANPHKRPKRPKQPKQPKPPPVEKPPPIEKLPSIEKPAPLEISPKPPQEPKAEQTRADKPYVYQPRKSWVPIHTAYAMERFAPAPPLSSSTFQQQQTPQAGPSYSSQRFQVKPTESAQPYSQSPPAALPQPAPNVAWQRPRPISQRYDFFQIHHNRDSSAYRTPYSPWGGFTNGYEGNLRAHFMANHMSLLKRPSFGSGSTSNRSGSFSSLTSAHNKGAAASASSPSPPKPPAASLNHANGDGITPVQSMPAPEQSVLPKQDPAHQIAKTPTRDQPPAQGHLPVQDQLPAQDSLLTQGQLPLQLADSEGNPVSKLLQVPSKESPIPLPANFIAALNKGYRVPTITPKPKTSSRRKKNATSPGSQVTPQTTPSMAALHSSSAEPSTIAQVAAQTTPTADNSLSSSAEPSTEPIFNSFTCPSVTKTNSATGQDPLLGPLPIPKVLAPTLHPAAAQAAALQSQPAVPRDQQMTAKQSGPPPRAQEFPDVPGSESMEFMERMMANLRRVSQQGLISL